MGDPHPHHRMNKGHLICTISVNVQPNPVWLLDKSVCPANFLSLYFCFCCSIRNNLSCTSLPPFVLTLFLPGSLYMPPAPRS